MDASDEPYDFLTWHSNAPVVKDEKKEKVVPSLADKPLQSMRNKSLLNP